MKYRVIRSEPQILTISEYCTQRGCDLEVRQTGALWCAILVNKGRTVYYGAAMSTIDKAIDQLCGAISCQSLAVIPGTDLEAAE